MQLDPIAGDVLAQFRTPGAAAVRRAGEESVHALPGYRAFGIAAGAAKPIRLDIRPKTGVSVARLYSALAEIAYDRASYTGILLIFAGKMVKLRGRNLRPVVEALVAGTCEYLTELGDGETPGEGEPVIDRIETVGPQKAAAPPEKE